MGKVRPEKVKKIARELVNRHRDQFGTDFEKNKRALDSMASIYSSKLRNLIAGYITRLVAISMAAEAGESEDTTGAHTEEAEEGD